MEQLPFTKYSKPKNSEEFSGPKHTFEYYDEEHEILSRASLEYFSKPLPFYEVAFLETYAAIDRNQGNAGFVMDQVESFLISKKRPGVLRNAIKDSNPTRGMYVKRGWHVVIQSDGKELYVFNWPKGVPLQQMHNYEQRYQSRRPHGKPGL